MICAVQLMEADSQYVRRSDCDTLFIHLFPYNLDLHGMLWLTWSVLCRLQRQTLRMCGEAIVTPSSLVFPAET